MTQLFCFLHEKFLYGNFKRNPCGELKLTEIEEGLPLVSLTGQLIGTHELIKCPLRNMFQDVLQKHQILETSSHFVLLTSTCWANLHVQIESVVEISTPKEVGEAQADVKGAVFLTQAEQSEDVQKVLIPPKHHTL